MSDGDPDEEPTQSQASARVIGDKYRVVRLVGEGGMGAVYEAENTWTKRRVALKVMRPDFARDPDSVQRFMREAQTAAQIDHPHVIDVLDMGRDEVSGALYIVQEFLDGADLRHTLDARGVLSPDEALALMLPALDGLAAAHARGVVHRDIKPENIFLVRGRDGQITPKVIDFGIAKALRPSGGEFRTAVTQAVGTPGYMSPEQARGESDIDARTDVWALGVVLFEMLSGALPYDDDDNPHVLMARVIMQHPRSLDVVAPGLPHELRAVVDRALRHDRDQRYPDAGALRDALAATAAGARARDTLRDAAPALVEAAASQPPSARVVDSTILAPAPTTVPVRQTGATSLRRAGGPALGLAGALLVVATAVALSRGRSHAQVEPHPAASHPARVEAQPASSPAVSPVARANPDTEAPPVVSPPPPETPAAVRPVAAPRALDARAPRVVRRHVVVERPAQSGAAPTRGTNGAIIMN